MVNPGNNSEFDTEHDLSVPESPFLLENESAYQHWRKIKLGRYSETNPESVISITVPASLSPKTMGEIAVQLETCNFAIFQVDTAERLFSTDDFLAFGRQLGLHRIDTNPAAETNGVTLLSAVDPADQRSRYIPYTNRALNWHTDGYYNPTGSRIDAFSLYCVNQAGQGGDNFTPRGPARWGRPRKLAMQQPLPASQIPRNAEARSPHESGSPECPGQSSGPRVAHRLACVAHVRHHGLPGGFVRPVRPSGLGGDASTSVHPRAQELRTSRPVSSCRDSHELRPSS